MRRGTRQHRSPLELPFQLSHSLSHCILELMAGTFVKRANRVASLQASWCLLMLMATTHLAVQGPHAALQHATHNRAKLSSCTKGLMTRKLANRVNRVASLRTSWSKCQLFADYSAALQLNKKRRTRAHLDHSLHTTHTPSHAHGNSTLSRCVVELTARKLAKRVKRVASLQANWCLLMLMATTHLAVQGPHVALHHATHNGAKLSCCILELMARKLAKRVNRVASLQASWSNANCLLTTRQRFRQTKREEHGRTWTTLYTPLTCLLMLMATTHLAVQGPHVALHHPMHNRAKLSSCILKLMARKLTKRVNRVASLQASWSKCQLFADYSAALQLNKKRRTRAHLDHSLHTTHTPSHAHGNSTLSSFVVELTARKLAKRVNRVA